MNQTLILARKNRGLSAAATAEQAGTLEMRIYAFERERHRPRKDEALRIAAVLGVDPWELWPELFGEGVSP